MLPLSILEFFDLSRLQSCLRLALTCFVMAERNLRPKRGHAAAVGEAVNPVHQMTLEYHLKHIFLYSFDHSVVIHSSNTDNIF